MARSIGGHESSIIFGRESRNASKKFNGRNSRRAQTSERSHTQSATHRDRVSKPDAGRNDKKLQ